MRRWLIALNIGNVCDIITTYIGLGLGAREVNPIIDYAINTIGFWPTAAAKLAFVALASVLLFKRSTMSSVRFITILVWLVVTNNLCHIAWRFGGF